MEPDDTQATVAVTTRSITRPASDVRPIIGGRLHHPETGHPLGGLRVVAELTSPGGEPATLGTAVSDAGGRFCVVPDSMPTVDGRPLGVSGSQLHLTVTDRVGRVWLRTEDVSAETGSDSLVLAVPVPPSRLTDAHWTDFTARLVDRRHTRLHEAIRHLVLAPTSESVVGDWAIELRHDMALALELALLDPTGVLTARAEPPTFFGVHSRDEWDTYRRRVESPPDPAVTAALDRADALYAGYPSPYRVDWELDLDALSRGHLPDATTTFEELYDVSVRDDTRAPIPFKRSPLVPYRDYLRTLYTGASDSDEETPAKVENLERRFHQSFKTIYGNQRPANAILAGIVKAILTAPTGDDYGFGIDPATIEAQAGRTDREYLDYLIGLSELSATELGKRYRIDLARPDSATSTPVEENIATLQGFFRDGYQSKPDPEPIFDEKFLGKAPFFLYYDEWLRRTGPFYPENFYRPAETFTCGVKPLLMGEATPPESDPHYEWWSKTVQAQEKLAEGQDRFRQGQYQLAITTYAEAWQLGYEAVVASVAARAKQPSNEGAVWQELDDAVTALGADLRGLPVASEADLAYFVNQARWSGAYPDNANQNDWDWWVDNRIGYRWLALIRLTGFLLPACVGEACQAAGDYASAVYFYSLGTRRPVGRGPTDTVAPYRGSYNPYIEVEFGSYDSGDLYRRGSLPYTLDVSSTPMEGWVPYAHDAIPETPVHVEWPAEQPESFRQRTSYWSDQFHDKVLHEVETRWFRLRQADAMVQWADTLYRTDEPGSIQRARELYKGAHFVVGANPSISPVWGKPKLAFGNGTENPALTVLKAQARKGITQIEAGLNYYGADDSLVPHLRYRTLKEAADRYASAAKSAESDLLTYLGNVENALVEQMMHANMLQKARLQAAIAGEQAKIAEFEVELAQRQVSAVEAEIKRKQEELEDESGLFEQFTDFIGGMKDAVVGLPGAATGFAGSGISATAGSGGASLSGSAALAAGGGVMAGYAIFIYAGVTSLTAVADNLTSLEKQIDALKYDALPLAKAQVTARERQVTIAELSRQIAEADAQLARDLIHFAQLRFLNVDFWSELSAVTRRLLRRYLTLGGRFAWLAERALAYEQDRQLDIVRLDYVPVKYQGITGAGQLLADLTELDVTRLDGLRQALPVRRTWSLAFDFPTQFAQLKTTGRCEFHTSDEFLRLAHPGSYAHRIETVRVRTQNTNGVNVYRGLLRNTGLSTMSTPDGSAHLSLRFEDALPLTDPGTDGWVATPGAEEEALGLFEGSGVDTTWVLELPTAANPYGLGDLADVLITLEARALYSSELHDEATTPTSVHKFVAVSAAKHSPKKVAAIQDPQVATVNVTFDLAAVGLPAAEQDREITNAFVILAAPGDGAGPVHVKAADQPNAHTVPLADGVALSNAGPLAAGQPARPLNALVGSPATQTIDVSIDKTDFAETDFVRATDLVLGIEYTAELSE